MLWELFQQSRIRGATATAEQANTKTSNLVIAVSELEDKVDSLSITCQALWELLRERNNVTEAELDSKVNEIDLRDGRSDGKMGGGGSSCAKCGRVLNKRHLRCMYCGESFEKLHRFQN